MSNSSRPFVSVITPTYNRRKFLPILIHLYQQQTYPRDRMELVILDDSPTNNEDIIPKEDKTIRYIYQSDKMTLGDKRNKLNKLAKGEIIICFDDDDFYSPERVRHAVTRLCGSRALIAGSTIIALPISESSINRSRFGLGGAPMKMRLTKSEKRMSGVRMAQRGTPARWSIRKRSSSPPARACAATGCAGRAMCSCFRSSRRA